MRSNRLSGLVFAAFLIGAGATTAFSQVRSMPPDPYDPRAASQPAPMQPGQMQQPDNAMPAGAAGPYANSYQGPTDFPASAIGVVPVARAQTAVARAVYDRARSSLYSTVDNLREDFEYSPQFQEALRNEKSAHEAYAAARERALAKLDSDSEYQTLRKLSADLSRKLEQLHQHPKENREEILATAQVKLDYSRLMSDKEADILIADPAVQQAKSRLLDAGARVADMRTQNNRALRRDPQFASARRSMDDAKIAFIGSDAYLQTSIDVANVALDYAYWIHRYDPYNYYPWSYVPYGNSVFVHSGNWWGRY